jgi:hypothetical protein
MWIIGPFVASLSPVFSVYISPWHWGFYPFIMFHGRRFVIIITESSLSLQQNKDTDNPS